MFVGANPTNVCNFFFADSDSFKRYRDFDTWDGRWSKWNSDVNFCLHIVITNVLIAGKASHALNIHHKISAHFFDIKSNSNKECTFKIHNRLWKMIWLTHNTLDYEIWSDYHKYQITTPHGLSQESSFQPSPDPVPPPLWITVWNRTTSSPDCYWHTSVLKQSLYCYWKHSDLFARETLP